MLGTTLGSEDGTIDGTEDGALVGAVVGYAVSGVNLAKQMTQDFARSCSPIIIAYTVSLVVWSVSSSTH
jgi:hypothetical protein